MSKRPASAVDDIPVAPTSEAECDECDESDEATPEQQADSDLETLGSGPDFSMYDMAVFGPRSLP